MRVLLLASGVLGLSLLEGLYDLQRAKKIEIIGVYPWSNTKKGATLKDPGEVKLKKVARKYGLKIINCPGANHFEFNQHIQALKPDLILVGCWGEILKAHLINRDDFKLVNCHPSKLPANRGANPYVSALMYPEEIIGTSGQPESGVTFHWITVGIDEGPVVHQDSIVLDQTMTGGDLRQAACDLARKMVPTVIERAETTTIADYPSQPMEGASYHSQITLADGLIDWEQPQGMILRRLRALKPWLSCYSMLQGQLLYIFHELIPYTREQFGQEHPQTLILNGRVPEQIPPGTVVSRKKDTIWIQGERENELFETRDYQFYLGWGFLPRFFSRLISRKVVHIGHRFLQAFVQGVVQQSQPVNQQVK